MSIPRTRWMYEKMKLLKSAAGIGRVDKRVVESTRDGEVGVMEERFDDKSIFVGLLGGFATLPCSGVNKSAGSFAEQDPKNSPFRDSGCRKDDGRSGSG